MRDEKLFLGDFEPDGYVDESDFQRGLAVVTEPGSLPKAQQYDALQAFVHWGLNGNRPDLALEAYDQYVIHSWTWQAEVNASRKSDFQDKEDAYYQARYEVEEETGEPQSAGIPYFTLLDLRVYGGADTKIRSEMNEGETFRNNVLPRILTGLLETGQVQKVYNFLIERRAAHGFKGYPRELEAEQCVDVHVQTAQTLLDPASSLVFDGDRDKAFEDLATFSLEHAQQPQFGTFQIVPRLAPIRQAMIEHGLTDPWEIFVSRLDTAVRRFNEGMFGVDALFNGIRRYRAAARAGEVEDIRSVRDWPDHALEAFDMVERSPSIPSGLAWLLPAAQSGNIHPTASDSFQSSPVKGANLLRAAAGDAEAKEKAMMHPGTTPELAAGTLTVAEALKIVTKS